MYVDQDLVLDNGARDCLERWGGRNHLYPDYAPYCESCGQSYIYDIIYFSLVLVTPRSCAGKTKLEECASETLCIKYSSGATGPFSQKPHHPGTGEMSALSFPSPVLPQAVWWDILGSVGIPLGKHSLVLGICVMSD